MARDSKLIPHSQRGTNGNYQVAQENSCSSCSSATAYLKLVVSRPCSRTIDIYSKIGALHQCEHSDGQNRRGVSAVSRGEVCLASNCYGTANCAGSAKCCETDASVDNDITRTGAGTECVINQQCATVYDSSDRCKCCCRRVSRFLSRPLSPRSVAPPGPPSLISPLIMAFPPSSASVFIPFPPPVVAGNDVPRDCETRRYAVIGERGDS